MDITHDILISLGFVKDHRRSERYRYKGFIGTMHLASGIFYFEGFGPGIGRLPDLKYLLMLIDYNTLAADVPYPSNNN